MIICDFPYPDCIITRFHKALLLLQIYYCYGFVIILLSLFYYYDMRRACVDVDNVILVSLLSCY